MNRCVQFTYQSVIGSERRIAKEENLLRDVEIQDVLGRMIERHEAPRECRRCSPRFYDLTVLVTPLRGQHSGD